MSAAAAAAPERRAVFLDRDGTLSRPPERGEYVVRPAELELLDGAGEAVALLARAGFDCVVVSNQRGVALGRMSRADLDAVDARLRELLAAAGAELEGSYYCTHGLDEDCDCRKPRPGLLQRAAAELGLDLAGSWAVGDSASDVEAGRRAGCRTLRVVPTNGALLGAAQTIIHSDARLTCPPRS